MSSEFERVEAGASQWHRYVVQELNAGGTMGTTFVSPADLMKVCADYRKLRQGLQDAARYLHGAAGMARRLDLDDETVQRYEAAAEAATNRLPSQS